MPGVILARVSPTLIKLNVDLNDLLTSIQNIFNSGGLSEKSYTNMYGRSAVRILKT